ncbi:hypothetical protein [Streptomyces avidinii]|uniref:Uncharacterized protein n=1 Tax=Streptomyces avidinii TaxID=1895 RepID=A0ABS4KY18_STRAV|nr:hypothetical protein [Streptomyces avidinii]MBP2034917.1 hypothetical protein [Streptomyces avidinii]
MDPFDSHQEPWYGAHTAAAHGQVWATAVMKAAAVCPDGNGELSGRSSTSWWGIHS